MENDQQSSTECTDYRVINPHLDHLDDHKYGNEWNEASQCCEAAIVSCCPCWLLTGNRATPGLAEIHHSRPVWANV